MLLLAALLTLAASLTPASLTPASGAPSVPSGPSGPDSPAPGRLPQGGAWLGAFVGIREHHTGATRQEAWASTEDVLGRTFAFDRTYRFWDSEPFIGPDDEASRDEGRTLLLSLTGRLLDRVTFTPWADIAAGLHDDVIDRLAQELLDFGAPVYFIFDHEPERWVDKPELPQAGTAADYVAAYQRVHDRLEAAGVPDVTYVLTLMSVTFKSGSPNQFYPGDAYVDMLGADGFNWYGCTGTVSDPTWVSFRSIFEKFHAYGVGKGKPMLIPEFASIEHPEDPQAKADWIRDAQQVLEGWPEIAGALYFHTEDILYPEEGCSWWFDSSEASLAAFQDLAHDPYFNPPLPGAEPAVEITSGPASPTPSTSASFTYTAGTAGVTYSCSLDWAPAQPCPAGGVGYSGLAEGPHLFSVRATDGGISGDAALWSWRVDYPPTVAITSGPWTLTPSTTARVTFEVDQPATTTCSLDGGPASTCSSPAVYTGLDPGDHALTVQATDPGGNPSAPATHAWTVAEIGSAVEAGVTGFQPSVSRIQQGQAVEWTVAGGGDHRVRDTTGMGLFDSGRLSSGESYAFPFVGAGTYPYECALHPGETGVVGVRLLTPQAGNVGVPFTVRWASHDPPPRFVFDVTVKPPGATSWQPWLEGTKALEAAYAPTRPGTFRFRSRVRAADDGASSRWSRLETVFVG